MRKLLSLFAVLFLLASVTSVYATPVVPDLPELERSLSDSDGILSEKIQYTDDTGSKKYVDNSWSRGVALNSWEMLHDDYHVKVNESITAVQFEANGESLSFRPYSFNWTNDLKQVQSIPMSTVTAIIGQTSSELTKTQANNKGFVRWDNLYGNGINLQWQCTPGTLEKVLEIETLSNLPIPAKALVNGKNPVLELTLAFNLSSDMDIFVNDERWDEHTTVQTSSFINFEKDGKFFWTLKPLQYWCSDNGLRDGESVATLSTDGHDMFISIRVPYSWLRTAIYPVYIDADVAINTGVQTDLNIRAVRGGIFWKSTTVGYVILVNSSVDLKYQKTSDGGATWAAAVNIRTGSIYHFDCWADWQTAGDTGTKIHIVYADANTDDIRYVSLETATDTVGGDDQIEAVAGSGIMYDDITSYSPFVSITKTRGGNIAVALRYYDSLIAGFEKFYTSPDGDTWTSKTSPWETASDTIQLYAGNAADNQDVWAAFWDISADQITLKTFDNSANSWSESASLGSMTDNYQYLQMDGQIRLSDGHLIFAAWNLYDNAAADLMVWDINGSASITAKTNVITNESETFTVSVFINQVNDDIYITYCSGGTAESTTTYFYQKSTNGGTNWGGETAMQADVADDERWVSAGCMKASLGGKFQPVWFNDDLDDLFTNSTNGVSIAAAAVSPTCTTQAVTNIEDTTATGNGTITGLGDGVTAWGICWNLGGNPTTADNTVAGSGAGGLAAFTANLVGLPTGTTIHTKAYVTDSDETAYGAEEDCLTKPAAPTNVAATDGTSETKVVITWTKSTGATNYHVWRGAADLGAAGDVATFDDSGATAGTITNSGVATASDGTSTAHVTLSLAGEAKGYTSHTYKVVASNATGDSDDSATDTGYRVCGAITYQWQEDSGGWANIAGGTTDPYNDTAAGAPTVTAGVCTASNGTSTAHVTLSIAGELGNNGATRNYRCVVSSTNASNSPQNSTENTGYRGTAALTYQWRVSAGDADAGYGNLAGATTDPHNDATAPAPTVTPGVATASDGISNTHVVLSIAGAVGNNGEGRWYYCQVSMVDATTQDTNHDRGYRGIALLTYEWFRSAADADAAFASIAVEGGTFIPYNDPNGATDPDGRWYYCTVSMADAADQDTDHNRGYMTAGGVGAAVYLPFPLLVPFATETIRRLFRRRRNG